MQKPDSTNVSVDTNPTSKSLCQHNVSRPLRQNTLILRKLSFIFFMKPPKQPHEIYEIRIFSHKIYENYYLEVG